MTDAATRQRLEDFRVGRLTLDQLLAWLGSLRSQGLGFACLDHQRPLRCGFPEVVYGAGKTVAQVKTIVSAFRQRGQNVLVTRLAPAAGNRLRRSFPAGVFDPAGGTFVLNVRPHEPQPGRVAVISAGTSDHAVAAEALTTLRFFGYQPAWLADLGVAGLHRLLAHEATLRELQVVIVIAGMEGALPSVVGGLVAAPVIAVPTSVGYGAGVGGFAALLGMLTSCASGVVVTNIDNGFGAACAAARILGQFTTDPAPAAAPAPPAATRTAKPPRPQRRRAT